MRIVSERNGMGGQQMNKADYEKLEEMANTMQHNPLIEMGKKVKEAQDYQQGYNQGVEDLLKYARRSLQNGE